MTSIYQRLRASIELECTSSRERLFVWYTKTIAGKYINVPNSRLNFEWMPLAIVVQMCTRHVTHSEEEIYGATETISASGERAMDTGDNNNNNHICNILRAAFHKSQHKNCPHVNCINIIIVNDARHLKTAYNFNKSNIFEQVSSDWPFSSAAQQSSNRCARTQHHAPQMIYEWAQHILVRIKRAAFRSICLPHKIDNHRFAWLGVCMMRCDEYSVPNCPPPIIYHFSFIFYCCVLCNCRSIRLCALVEKKTQTKKIVNCLGAAGGV